MFILKSFIFHKGLLMNTVRKIDLNLYILIGADSVVVSALIYALAHRVTRV